ncbi:MAG: hypothetical protein QOG65_2595 [Actinomycetota bacterium]|jgi:uncharacterized cupredoxin-like copper-binding protein|nr:hypothetical protein [Actinomycetota bacterium]MDQ1385216.1 hypothetical protein [Actinomycetota bacterium]
MAGESDESDHVAEHTSSGVNLLPTFLGVAVALLVCATVLIIGLAGRSTGGLKMPAGYNVVQVQEFTYGFRLPSTTLPAGNNLFVDHNTASIPHEFVIFKTNDPGDQLPLAPDQTVKEDSTALEDVVDSGTDIPPGDTRLMAADLAPGHYVLVCNLPGHYQGGMHVDITVK